MVAEKNGATSSLRLPDFGETKRLLDRINALISKYDPVLKEQARDILLKSAFDWENPNSDARNRLETALESSHSQTKSKVPSLKDHAEMWQPRTCCETALLGLYYLKIALGLRSATGRQVQNELKQNGMELANISVAMYQNVRLLRVHSTVINGKKNTRQARNRYAVTDFGIQYVESRFNRGSIELNCGES